MLGEEESIFFNGVFSGRLATLQGMIPYLEIYSIRAAQTGFDGLFFYVREFVGGKVD